MKTTEFDYELPGDLIAQKPASRREGSRLLVMHRRLGRLEHRNFGDLADYLERGDVLVVNDSRVIPARLRGEQVKTGGRFELLLLTENATNDWWAMLRPGRRAPAGARICLLNGAGARSEVIASVVEINAEGHRRLKFSGTADLRKELDDLGEAPLPPYIRRSNRTSLREDRDRYQTVYAREAGSVAAPTAGLHFTGAFLDTLGARGVAICRVTLHVGLGTFAPVKAETLSEHSMHAESYTLNGPTAAAIMRRRREGGRVFAVGTTTVRVLESVAARNDGQLCAQRGSTRLFVHPPFNFQIVDALITNFHLPRSTLLMLVSAFAAPGALDGRERVLAAYAEAVRKRYRFFSYGDAMLIV